MLDRLKLMSTRQLGMAFIEAPFPDHMRVNTMTMKLFYLLTEEQQRAFLLDVIPTNLKTEVLEILIKEWGF